MPNLRGVSLAARLNSIASVARLLPLLVVVIGRAFFIDGGNLHIDTMPAAGDVARTSLLLIFAFAGIECALVPSGKVRDTARTVPRAIALAMIGITLLYIGLQMVAQSVLGAGLAKATVSLLADVAGASLGGWARALLLGGASISMCGYLGGMTLSIPHFVRVRVSSPVKRTAREETGPLMKASGETSGAAPGRGCRGAARRCRSGARRR